MKLHKYLLIATCAVLTTSCAKDLDIKPTSFISDDAVWEDKTLIDKVVANAYGSMLCGFNRCTAGYGQNWSMSWSGNLDAGTDDFACVSDSPIYTQLNKDAITAQSCPFAHEIWIQEYDVIRKANTIIEKVATAPDQILNADQKRQIEAEARFLRAFCHFEVARTFGKAPLLTHAQTLDEDLLVAPASFEEIVNFIVSECDTYAGNLPVSYPAKEIGHATRGAFMALKARALLYMASPLYSTDDPQRWAKAAKAAKDVMDLKVYSLYTKGSTPYRDMEFDKTTANHEVIFERRFSFPDAPHNIHMMWSLDAYDAGSWNGLYPTQNLVDAYETTDGRLIDDPDNTLYDPQNPYVNRDARFYQSILYNGSMWESYEINIETNTVDPSKSGSCKPKLGKARCGYGPKKFIEELAPGTNIYGGYGQDNNFPYLRYAEVLLNYAEAQNEALGAPDQSVYDAINKVRNRSGQPDLPSGLSKEQMRKRIKNERRVELLLEEHRFYDLRRWKDGYKLAEPIMGMNIYNDNVSLRYEISKVEDRVFTGEHYFLPIPLAEQEKNPLLKE